ncbi:protein hobbit isoform X2 [Macrosteles quadrilineatus]|uniref:protein hobbit isoform X2 n=1 Tax=Macrosteles quadrilineatus TaxID=74068 RepID=UPI0023E20A5D|nr:protein hobbit isoform X2 [Macrosteles quadrilineatus]
MDGFGVLVLVCGIFYLICKWLLPELLTWIIKRKFHIEIRIGRIGFFYFTLRDVFISKNGFNVHIDKIGFRSSFLSSEVAKLLSVVVHDVRINKDVKSRRDAPPKPWQPPPSFHDQKIPPIVITFAQFMAVDVHSVTGVFLRAQSPEWLCHVTLSDLHIDGSVLHSCRSLLVNVTMGSSSAKLLRHAPSSPTTSEACLAELSVALTAEATLVAQGPLSIEKVYVGLEHTKAVINDGFYSFAQERNKTTSNSTKPDFGLIVQRLAPIIPKSLTVKLEDALLQDLATLHSLKLSTRFIPAVVPHAWPQLSLELEVNQLHVNNKTLSLHNLNFSTDVMEKVMNVHLSLNSLTVSYDHEHVFSWVRTHLLQPDSDKELTRRADSWDWLQGMELRASAELWNVTTMLHLDPTAIDSVCGVSHLKVVCTCQEGQQLTAELLLESVWCRLGSCPVADATCGGKCHVWGSPVHLGVALVKLRGVPGAPLRLQGMLDHGRLEWSPPLAELLLHSHTCLRDYQSLRGVRPPPSSPSLPISLQVDSTINITNANLFFITDKKVCLVVRSDKTTMDTRHSKIAVTVEGAKLMSLSPTKAQFTCLRSEEIKLACGHIKMARAEWHRSDNMWLVEFSHEFEAVWSPNLHLKILTLFKEMKALRNALITSEEQSETVSQPTDLTPSKLQVQVKAHLRCNLILSSKHNLMFTTDDIFYTSSESDSLLESSSLKIAVDGANIFTFDGLVVKRLHDSEIVKVERANSDGFVLPWNKTWGVSIKSLKAIFPYEHNFTDAVQKEFISIVKWLKIIHRKHKSKTQPESLPSDLVIKVHDFLFEMSDDPFEVKLRDNYELLEDEYKESLKREKMLEAKVAQLYKDRLSLPAGKVEELYSNLNKLNSQIYVQRSRQMKQAGTRTRLFAWIMSDVEILALADPSIHGPEHVTRVMSEIDCDTPWPEEGVEFTTLWCRSVTASCTEWKFQLRDFPQPWLDIGQLHMWGRLVGAEQMPNRRAKREVLIELGEPWGHVEVERSMTSLKFYHDLNCEVEHFSYAFGPCWEPVIAQCNLSFEKISRPSLDPSPPLSFWDKMRLLIHGQLTMEIHQLTVLLHASLDPYNTTEEMEVTWSNVVMDWTNAKVVFKGNFDIWVRTASKYDDCRLLHLPNLKLSIKLTWMCLGNPNDHHSVMPCAPDKLPEYSSNQVHDSFRAFRSQNLNVTLSLETKPMSNNESSDLDCPVALLYGSTLRWFENLKLILSGVTRPTRRGPIFNNLRPRKIPLSRHYRTIHLSLALHRFHIHYWMSFAMQRGLELTGQRISSSSEHTLTLVPIDDGLKHRPRPEWSIVYMTCELNDAEVWLKSALREESGEEPISLCNPVEKCYCLSVGKVSYGREASALGAKRRGGPGEGNPTHRLVVHHLKGAWTMSNREVAFALFDSFMKTKQLKKNLSTEALKGFRKDSTATPLKSRSRSNAGQATPPAAPPPAPAIQATPSPMTKLQSGQAATMLQQLIAEAENKNVVFSDDMSVATREQHLQGLAASQMDDVVHKNWLIALVNSQVLLKGIETKGYVILSAAKAEILQRVHRPVWKERTLVSKTTWVGSLECMQYYATVSPRESYSMDENIMWLNVENIQEKEGTVIADLPDLPHLVGSGGSVGGVVSETVGASSSGDKLQLQRIVSRCKCEFFYVGYGESSMDPHNLEEVPPVPSEEPSTPWERRETAVDAFTLMHHDLDVCTNSLQYAMILDIVNNLLLYVPPRRKEAYERLQRMRFQLQLCSVQDQHRPIQQLQNHVRSLVSKLRKLEKEMYLVQRALADEPSSEHLLSEMKNVEAQINECKEQLQSSSDELDMMLSCYKETQLSANQKLATTRGDKPVTVVRANEICFKHAQWRLTDADGQLGIADLVLSNFLYTKNSKSDDSVEHLLELGYVRMTNLLPNEVYPEVIVPTEIHSNMPVDRKRAVRVFCREKAPVGGISVKEHFEINVVPLTIGLTKKFYNTMLRFCFPERDPENIEGDGVEETDSSSTTSKKSKTNEKSAKKGKDSNFYVRIDPKDDVEKMKERAEKNKLFIYIKIPEVPMKVSYKGNKEKNIEDMQDMNLVIPTLEYHNVTWTWLDLLLAMKNDSRRVILPQAIKQKFQIKVKRGVTSEGPSPQEEDKARILFGPKLMPQESRSQKKGVFKLPN